MTFWSHLINAYVLDFGKLDPEVKPCLWESDVHHGNLAYFCITNGINYFGYETSQLAKKNIAKKLAEKVKGLLIS